VQQHPPCSKDFKRKNQILCRASRHSAAFAFCIAALTAKAAQSSNPHPPSYIETYRASGLAALAKTRILPATRHTLPNKAAWAHLLLDTSPPILSISFPVPRGPAALHSGAMPRPPIDSLEGDS